MTRDAPLATAIVIPARNEQARIGACLARLALRAEADVLVVLVANNCTDHTIRHAHEVATVAGLRLAVLECSLPVGAGVGTARRLGAEQALGLAPDLQTILTTDADCLVAPDWIQRNRAHLREVAAVCGQVTPMKSELAVLDKMDPRPAEMEGRYEQLVQAFYRRMAPGPLGLDGPHGCAAGASIGIGAEAYRKVGGFADLATGEDRDLIRRLKTGGLAVRHAGDVRVAASCRLEGRAQGGMAQALRARVSGSAYLIDDALPPAPVLIRAARENRLGPWPMQVAPADRLRACDLGPHIALLQEALRHLDAGTAHAEAEGDAA